MKQTLTDNGGQIFCDGGVIGANPSPAGGTWAWVLVCGGHVVRHCSGIVTPTAADLPTISNNLTELLAAVEALENIRSHDRNWAGTIYTDSKVTLLRLTQTFSQAFAGIPRELRDRARAVATGKRWKAKLVKGHPTAKHLKAGHWDGVMVSKWNCWCDKECQRLAAEFACKQVAD